MRIAHIDTERGWRGGQQQLVSLCRALAERGHSNWIALRPDGILAERISSISAVPIPIRPLGEWDYLTGRRLLKRLQELRIDVVHGHSGHGVAIGAMATHRTKIPLIASRRIDFPLRSNVFSRWKHRQVRHFAAVSENVRGVMMACGISPGRISVVRDGIDFGRFRDIRPVPKSAFGLPDDCLLIGTVCALVPHKDPITFVRSIAELRKTNRNVRGAFVGDGPLRDSVREEIRRLGLERDIVLLGFKSDPLNYLATFDLFCLSSSEEGFGSSLLDAMALRVPVAATRAGGIPEVIEDSVTGYLAEPRNPSSLAVVLGRALREKADNGALVDRAARRCREFDITETAKAMESIYQASLASR